MKSKQGGKRVGAGRKPTGNPRAKFVTIGFSAKQEFAEVIKTLADEDGISVATWVKLSCLYCANARARKINLI